jgi:DNA-binding transcriptional ArsR family regulator
MYICEQFTTVTSPHLAHQNPSRAGLTQPILWLGLIGFSEAQQEHVQKWLLRVPSGWPTWRLAPYAVADAWWVQGLGMRLVGEGQIDIPLAGASGPPVSLDLARVDRPIAFAQPLNEPGFEPRYTLDVDDEASVRHVLQQFEAWLRPLRAQFALAGEVVRREQALRSGVHHLQLKGHLLAMVDLNHWLVGLSPKARPVDLLEASWQHRPALAHDMPSHFLRIRLSHLLWAYAMRSVADVLPQRLRSEPIYFRCAPMVPQVWLGDNHRRILEVLASRALTFNALQQRLGVRAVTLGRDLSCLYYAGAITSVRANAAPVGSDPSQVRARVVPQTGFDSQLPLTA